MSQLIVQIYKLSHTALRTKARVVRVKHDLLPFVLQVKPLIFLTGIIVNGLTMLKSTQKRTTARRPRLVRGAMHSGKKWHNALSRILVKSDEY